MKNLTKLVVLVLAISLATGCAKERNNYDKWLTDGEWSLSSGHEEDETVTDRNYVDANDVDYVDTDRETAEYNGSTRIEKDYNSFDPATGTTTFQENITNSNYTSKITFSEDGTYTMTYTEETVSVQQNDENSTGTVFNIDDEPNTFTVTGYWTWQNTTDTKTVILIDELGIFEVEISKDELKLTRESSQVENSTNTSGSDYSQTSTHTRHAEWVWKK